MDDADAEDPRRAKPGEDRIDQTLRLNLVLMRDGEPTDLPPHAIADIALQEMNRLESLLKMQRVYITELDRKGKA